MRRSLCSSEASTRDISDSSTFPASWWPAASPCCHPEFVQLQSERLVEPASPHWGCFLWNTLLMEDLHCTLAVWPCQACPKPTSCSCRNLSSSSWRGSTATTSYNKPAGTPGKHRGVGGVESRNTVSEGSAPEQQIFPSTTSCVCSSCSSLLAVAAE